MSLPDSDTVQSAEEEDATVDLEFLLEDEKNSIEIYNRYNRGVVNIMTLTIQQNWLRLPVPREGSGSGSIIREDGLVLTNHHVVKDARTLTVTLYDGSSYEAGIIGIDPENDIALVQFDPQDKVLHTMPLPDNPTIQVGQKVIALGNPFGLERTLTTGVVSGVRRPIITEDGFILKDLIQIDAAINPGNSGGPLFNSKGELIGMNTLIISPTGASVGIGFSVPWKTINRVIPDLIQHGKVRRGWMEISALPLYPALVTQAKLPKVKGLLVVEVTPGSEADKAGLRGGNRQNFIIIQSQKVYLGGDIIYGINKRPVQNFIDFLNALEDTHPGDRVEVDILRGDQELRLEIPLTERPKSFPW